MGLAKSFAISLVGLSGSLIEVEADLSSNLPGFVIVGLPDASILEASARVRAATSNSGLALPNRKLTVNLSPAAVPKFGSSFDLAIAIAALRASGVVKDESKWVFIGELGLDGQVKPVRGVLPAVMSARNNGFERVMVPAQNYAEAALVSDITVKGVSSLSEAVVQLGGELDFSPPRSFHDSDRADLLDASHAFADSDKKDIADILGQEAAIEALVIAATGGHNILLVGSPGVGKTMMAERLPGLLPDLDMASALETTAVHSISKSNSFVGSQLLSRPPFQAPHHSASSAAIIGGGLGVPTPGIVSLAHNGVLFLDEAPEFQLPALESLRQSIESHEVTIARAAGVAKFPARFQLVLSANPCPCGMAMSKKTKCICTPAQRMRYLSRLSGPLLDRIDIRLRIAETSPAAVAVDRKRQNRLTTAEARARIELARAYGISRNQEFGFRLNAYASTAKLSELFGTLPGVTADLDRALRRGAVNMRGYDRCLRLALTIADLDQRSPTSADVAHAMVLRGEDRLIV